MRSLLTVFLILIAGSSTYALKADQVSATYLPSKELKQKALHFVLTKGCLADHAYFSNQYELSDFAEVCDKGAETLIKSMDMFSNIAFPQLYETKIKNFSHNTSDKQFIDSLWSELSGLSFSRNKFDLWDYFISNSSSAEQALERIAVCFQGTVAFKGFLDEEYYTNEKPFIKMLNNMIFAYRDNLKNIKININGLEIHHLKLYHFFSPAYLTQHMMKNGVPKDVAIYFGFKFNWIYEIIDDSQFINTSKKDGILTKLKKLGNGIGEFKFRERPMDEATSEDVIAGYAGAIYGSGGSFNNERLAYFKNLLQKNPAIAVHEMLLELPH